MTKARLWDRSEWPRWLLEAWDKAPDQDGCLNWLDGAGIEGKVGIEGYEELWINTLEGAHKVSWDDWIIQGVKGELYPCKPDIFEITYQAIE